MAGDDGGTNVKLLAVDTSTEACSVALWVNGVISSRLKLAGRGHGELLRAWTSALLAEAGLRPAELEGLACGIGPGSFAGVRTGVAFIQGMALALDLPVVPLVSLELLAAAQMVRKPLPVAAAIDARMSEVYCALYAGDSGTARPVPIAAPAVALPERAYAPFTSAYAAAGSGWASYRDALIAGLGGAPASIAAAATPDAAIGLPWVAADLADGRGLDPAELQPLYLRNKVALTQAEQAAQRSVG